MEVHSQPLMVSSLLVLSITEYVTLSLLRETLVQNVSFLYICPLLLKIPTVFRPIVCFLELTLLSFNKVGTKLKMFSNCPYILQCRINRWTINKNNHERGWKKKKSGGSFEVLGKEITIQVRGLKNLWRRRKKNIYIYKQ